MKIPTVLAEKIALKFRKKQCDTTTSGCITFTTTD